MNNLNTRVDSKKLIEQMDIESDLKSLLLNCPDLFIPENRDEMLDLALGGRKNDYFEVEYEVPDKGTVLEATVTRCKNGLAINYADIYLRRRDPDSMIIGDSNKSDKLRYRDKYGADFGNLRQLSLEWLSHQKLVLIPFMAGGEELGLPMVLVAPQNATFFAAALADLQGFLPASALGEDFSPKGVVYLCPPFRHTHFEGKQIVVHNRLDDIYELFSYNLYPGPSAKKGIYGVLLKIGEENGWITAHGSTVTVVTPYDNLFTIMHEGASGSGKSEMTEKVHRDEENKLLVGRNLVTGEKLHLELRETCDLLPVTDDMALCHPMIQNTSKKLVVTDAENGWFIRTDHITDYGTDPQLEKLCIRPPQPLIFLNIQAVPGSTCLIWEHIMDGPKKVCPNPRIIIPRKFIPKVVNEPTEVDIRSFGVRTPPSTAKRPSYGILGMFHILPPALAWLWRLVAPRGYANPSITDSSVMSSEGVGSYWPFATGRMVDQANLLLNQIIEYSDTRYILIPNQHIGAYKVGFAPQWIAREYLARRGSAKFKADQITESKCPLLGYSLNSLKVDGTYMMPGLLQTHLQPELGEKGFMEGAKILTDFFKSELHKYLTPDLNPLGAQIIHKCLEDAPLSQYLELTPTKL